MGMNKTREINFFNIHIEYRVWPKYDEIKDIYDKFDDFTFSLGEIMHNNYTQNRLTL